MRLSTVGWLALPALGLVAAYENGQWILALICIVVGLALVKEESKSR